MQSATIRVDNVSKPESIYLHMHNHDYECDHDLRQDLTTQSYVTNYVIPTRKTFRRQNRQGEVRSIYSCLYNLFVEINW